MQVAKASQPKHTASKPKQDLNGGVPSADQPSLHGSEAKDNTPAPAKALPAGSTSHDPSSPMAPQHDSSHAAGGGHSGTSTAEETGDRPQKAHECTSPVQLSLNTSGNCHVKASLWGHDEAGQIWTASDSQSQSHEEQQSRSASSVNNDTSKQHSSNAAATSEAAPEASNAAEASTDVAALLRAGLLLAETALEEQDDSPAQPDGTASSSAASGCNASTAAEQIPTCMSPDAECAQVDAASGSPEAADHASSGSNPQQASGNAHASSYHAGHNASASASGNAVPSSSTPQRSTSDEASASSSDGRHQGTSLSAHATQSPEHPGPSHPEPHADDTASGSCSGSNGNGEASSSHAGTQDANAADLDGPKQLRGSPAEGSHLQDAQRAEEARMARHRGLKLVEKLDAEGRRMARSASVQVSMPQCWENNS